MRIVYSTSKKYRRLELVPQDFDGKYRFNEVKAARVIRFFETCLTHEKGKLRGQPVLLDPWEKRILRDIFGWEMVDADSGDWVRRFKRVFLFLPKKNGKSLLASGIALYLLVCDREPGTEVYSCANDKKQASLVFNVAAGMVRRCAQLKRRIKVTDSQKVMASHGNGGSYITLSSDAFNKDGLNPHGYIHDEIHAAPNRDLYDTVSSAMVSRDQPLEVVITTAGEYRPESIGFEIYSLGKEVLEGTNVDPHFYPVLYEAPADCDPFDPELWEFVNPGYGVSVKRSAIESKAIVAKAKPTNLNEFKRKHLNLWTNAISAWIQDIALWAKCKRDWKPEEMNGRICYVGMDFAKRIDITAVSLIFPMDDGTFRIEMRYFIPEETALEKSKTDRVPYHLWKEAGWITFTPGDAVDDDWILDQIKKDCKQYKVREARRDRWGSQNINTQLEKAAETKNKIVEHGQGFKDMSGPMHDLEVFIKKARIHHRGDPVLAWMISNTVAKMDESGNIKPDKNRSTCRIDGVVALIMALAACLSDKGKGRSIYNDKELKGGAA